MNIAVVDDIEDDLIKYTSSIESSAKEVIDDCHFFRYSYTDDLLEDIDKFDVVFLDCKMPGKDGIEIAEEIRKIRNDVILVFFSDYDSYVWKSFDCHAIYFIRKQYFKVEIDGVIERIDNAYKKLTPNLITIEDGKDFYNVDIRNVFYFEAEGKKLRIVSKDGERYVKYRISSIEKKVENFSFFKVHRSFIVNMAYVKAFGKDVLEMFDGRIISVSKYRYQEARNYYLKYMSEGI